jgi:DNA (cytosine-5)-methyltransferase 1/DNA (cytosine-5)-methyltransferase 3A
MNVLSLFNGMSFGYMALDTLGIEVDNYYSSEIDKHAIKAAQALYPDTIQLGDVLSWKDWDIDWASIDLVTGGFPCQAWSMAGKQLGDKDDRGMLFWTMLDIMKYIKELNPNVKFLIENVKMKKDFEQYITTHTENALGCVYKILINSTLVSAQTRNRYYWTNFKVTQPEDKGIMLSDVLEDGVIERGGYTVDTDYFKRENLKPYSEKHRQLLISRGGTARVSERGRRLAPCGMKRDDVSGEVNRGYEVATVDKSCCLTTVQKDNYIAQDYIIRRLTPRECFRLQTVPEYHINVLLNSGISESQLYKMCGNGWTHDVIVHILNESGLK